MTSVIDYMVVVIYLAGVIATGLYFSREQDSEDYFVGGRQMPWVAVGLSIVATMLSTVTYLAAPGEMILHGVALAIGWLSLPLAFLVVNYVWVPFFMRLGVTSIYEYLQFRFGRGARLTAAILFVFILRVFWMATIVLTASQAVALITHASLDSVFGIEIGIQSWTLIVLFSVGVLATLYTMLGGIKAVIWTDVAQFIGLSSGVVLTLFFVWWNTGTGPVDWWRNVTAGSEGHAFPPLVSFDITTRNTVLFTVLNVFCWYACTFIADQVAVQRYLTTSSVKAATRGNIVNFAADFAVMVLLALCGMALLTYYLTPGFETEIYEGISDPRNADVADKVFPHFIAHGLPVGISGLVVAALFAVAMSSLDSGLNSVSAVVTIDLLERDPAKSTDTLKLAKATTLIVGCGCTLLAFALLNIPADYNIIGVTARTFNCALGPLGGLFVIGMFSRRTGQREALVATFTGLIIAISSAWWVELRWSLGLTEFEALADATKHLSGPSPFLVTPFAVTSTILIGFTLPYILGSSAKAEADKFLWKSIVQSDRTN